MKKMKGNFKLLSILCRYLMLGRVRTNKVKNIKIFRGEIVLDYTDREKHEKNLNRHVNKMTNSRYI